MNGFWCCGGCGDLGSMATGLGTTGSVFDLGRFGGGNGALVGAALLELLVPGLMNAASGVYGLSTLRFESLYADEIVVV